MIPKELAHLSKDEYAELSRKNHQLGEDMMAAMHEGGLKFLDYITDDFKLTVPGHPELLPWPTSVEGKAGFGAYGMALRKHIEAKPEVKAIVAEGNTIVFFIYEQLKVLHNNYTFDLDEVWVATVKDGKCCEIKMFEDTAKVVAAVRGKDVNEL